MNPIPLRDYYERIWIYACGVCRHVASGTSLLSWDDCPDVAELGWTPGPHPQLVESSFEQAERCCRCYRCKQPIDRQSWSCECKECREWTAFTQGWYSLYHVAMRGFTREQYEAWLDEVEDD